MTDEFMVVILVVMWSTVIGVFAEIIQSKMKLKKMNDKQECEEMEK